MSMFRLTMAAVVMSVSVFAINGYAQAAASTTTSTTATAPANSMMKVTPATKAGKAQVNLNTADSTALAKVKGIGPKKAQAIVAYRTKTGNFTAVDDLKNVKNAKGKAYFNAKQIKKLSKKLTV